METADGHRDSVKPTYNLLVLFFSNFVDRPKNNTPLSKLQHVFVFMKM